MRWNEIHLFAAVDCYVGTSSSFCFSERKLTKDPRHGVLETIIEMGIYASYRWAKSVKLVLKVYVYIDTTNDSFETCNLARGYQNETLSRLLLVFLIRNNYYTWESQGHCFWCILMMFARTRTHANPLVVQVYNDFESRVCPSLFVSYYFIVPRRYGIRQIVAGYRFLCLCQTIFLG